MNRLVAVALVSVLALAGTHATAVRAEEILIGSGSKAGLYYPVSRAICRLVNRAGGDLKCSAFATAGSLFNLSNVRGGAIEFGLAQSDSQYHAVNKSGPFRFQDADYGELRAVFSLYSEAFTLVARRDSGIRKLADLPGRRVNIGNPGSGQRATMDVVMKAQSWSKSDFTLAEELPASQQSLALCHGRFEAMIYTVGHPNASIAKATELCDAVIVQVKDAVIDRLVARYPYYTYATVPGHHYPGNPEPVVTFGVKATLVTSSAVDADTVYALVKAIFDNLGQFRRMHPALGTLAVEKMVSEGLSAPLHAGARRYYREKGIARHE